MIELLIAVGVHLVVLGVPMYLTVAWWNARTGVRHYESLIPSYEGFVAYWRDKDQRHYREVLATLIKHRRSLRRAERYSWPFPIVRDEDIIARDEAERAKRAKPTEQAAKPATEQAAPTRDEARRYRSLAKDARDEATRAEADGLDGGVWHSLAAMWDEAAEAAVSARFAAECTCERHRAERREAS